MDAESVEAAIEAFKEGATLVRPYLHLEGAADPLSPDETLAQGIARLVEASSETYWEANWFLGKAYEAIGDYEKSAQSFGDAYAQEKRRKEVAREYLVALLRVRDVARALEVAEACDQKVPLLAFDTALVLFAASRGEEAFHLLNDFTWPDSYQARVTELTRRIDSRR